MAVSLVSTGVQFPDSTIQTTAAGASSMTLITSTTSTSGTNLIFTGLSSSYRAIIFSFTNIKNSEPSNNAVLGYSLCVSLSNNNGSSYASSGYLWLTISDGTQGSGTTRIDTRLYANNRAGSGASGQFILWNPAASGVAATFSWNGAYTYSGQPGYGNSYAGTIQGGGGMVTGGGAGYSAVNAVNFYWDQNPSFTSGTWKVYGMA